MSKIQNEKWVNALPDEAVSIAEEINIEIAKVIAERIKTIGELSPSDVKKLTNSLEYLGADFQKITKLIAKYSGKGQQAVVDTLEQVADANDDFAKTFYSAKGIAANTWHTDQYLNTLVEAMTRQTAAEFTNLSQTLAFKIDDRYLPLRQMYTKAIDKAIYEVQSGTVDYHTAMRKTVKDLATGLRVKDSALVVDKETGEVKLHWESGYSRRLDSHVRQNLIDGVKQLQAQMLDYHGEKFGSDGVELSAHAICAPDHLPVQGRQFSNEEFFKLQNTMEFEDVNGNEYEAIKRPIGQWNCRHVRFPIIIGISEPVHSEEQLKEFAENSKKKYDLTQQQRAMETKLRSLKTRRLAASAAGDELEAKRLQRKINEQQTIYRRFSEKHGLLYDTKRASVEGYRRISVKETSRVNNNIVKSPIEDIAKPVESGIIENKEISNVEQPQIEYKELTLEGFKKLSHPITKAERQILYGKGHFSGYINSSNARKLNQIIRNGGTLSNDYKNISTALQTVINRNRCPDNLLVTRYVTPDALESITGVKAPVASLLKPAKEYFEEFSKLPELIQKGHKYTEKAFLSTSGVFDKNVMQDKGVMLKIKVPQNTNCYITTNYKESEIIFGKNTTLVIENSYVEDIGTSKHKVVLECIIENEVQ